jgi:tyrosyl-tRNA synthetase
LAETVTVEEEVDFEIEKVQDANREAGYREVKTPGVKGKRNATYEIEMKNGTNPKDAKMRLASELVTLYHTEKDATLAKNSWIETFEKGGVPEIVPELVTTGDKELANVLVEAGIVISKTDWRRLIDEKAVTDVEKGTIVDPKILAHNGTFKIGKKRFVKIVIA